MSSIKISNNPTPTEVYSALELQRYFYQLTNELLPIDSTSNTTDKAKFVLMYKNGALHSELENKFPALKKEVKEQGYILETVKNKSSKQLIICGGDEVGLFYGVYGLLEDHYGVAFYYSGDVLPEKKVNHTLKNISEIKEPEVPIRGILPWTNFPQSATVYSWADWKFIIDQTAKMRMNFILVHNYNGACGHNEMFHNFTYKNFLSRSWMPTIKTGHGWKCPGWDQKEYLFGGSDIYDDYDFGADCALHNENLSNKQTFEKGVSLFQRVLQYAHSRGVKMGLGLDIDLIPHEYKAEPFDPELVTARVEQITSDYSSLDYLFCFQSEMPNKDAAFYDRWNKTFDAFYQGIKTKKLNTRIAVSGWGLTAESVSHLPNDVICAPISHYSSGFESGDIYGDREYWGCPWLERDFNSSQYYFPYNVDIKETIKAYQTKSKNMHGLYSLTWRLADAIEPKMWYVSKAPWRNDLTSSEKVYNEYAITNYGKLAANDITSIINQNEAFATDFAECQDTPKFDQVVYTYPFMNVLDFELKGKNKESSYKAVDFAEQKGTQNSDTKNGAAQCVGYIEEGDWLKYSNVSFDNTPTTLVAQFASASNGGIVKVRIDAPDGQVIGEIQVKNTEGWHVWKEFSTELLKTTGVHDLYFTFHSPEDFAPTPVKADKQIAVVESYIKNTTVSNEQKYKLGLLKNRLEGVKYHIELNRDFASYQWSDLPGKMPQWVESFTNRITDISTFGNIQSIESRFVQQNYLSKVNEMYTLQEVKAPYNVLAKGTKEGAILTWVDKNPDTRKFIVYRDGNKIGEANRKQTKFQDTHNGKARYTVSAINADGVESIQSIYTDCLAGSTDNEAPLILAVSLPSSHFVGEPLQLKIILKDGRINDNLSAKIHYRNFGSAEWITANLDNKVKYTFTASIPQNDLNSGIEYYITATDGTNNAVFPRTAPSLNKTILVHRTLPINTIPPPQIIAGENELLLWKTIQNKNVHQYKIYRDKKIDFSINASTFVTYVSKYSNSYRDNREDFEGNDLTGSWYYKITAIDLYGNESEASEVIHVTYNK